MTYRPTPTFVATLVTLAAVIAFASLLTGCGGGGDDGTSEVPPVNCYAQPRPPACL